MSDGCGEIIGIRRQTKEKQTKVERELRLSLQMPAQQSRAKVWSLGK